MLQTMSLILLYLKPRGLSVTVFLILMLTGYIVYVMSTDVSYLELNLPVLILWLPFVIGLGRPFESVFSPLFSVNSEPWWRYAALLLYWHMLSVLIELLILRTRRPRRIDSAR